MRVGVESPDRAPRRTRTDARAAAPRAVVVALAVLASLVVVGFGRGGATPAPTLASALPARLPESTGKAYYVDGQRGADRGPGTIKRPWRTITFALQRASLRGSTVYVRAGTYSTMIRFERRADPSNPITLRPYPGEHVLLTAPPKTDLHALSIRGASGLRIRGFEITAPEANNGVKIENSDSIELTASEIHHTGRSGVLVAGTSRSAPTGTRNVQIWGNRFHDNGSDARFDHSLYFGGVISNTDGIDHTSYGGVIANNVFYNQPVGYQLQIGSSVSGLIVTNNTFYRPSGPSPAGGAIVLYSEAKTPAFVTRNVLVVNNLISGATEYGIYGSGGGGLMATNVVRNNLAYGNGKGDFLPYWGSTAKVLFQLGPNFTGRRPLFVLPRGLDFRLQARSPAVGKADPAYSPATDFANNPRDASPDLGAFERVRR